MGYYTDFELGIHCDVNGELLGDSRRKEFIEYIRSSSEDGYLLSFLRAMTKYPEDGTWSCGESMKWYGHEVDMKELSLKFSDVVFVLKGKGEQHEDLWHKYFMNGRMQLCPARIEIEYPPFDYAELVDIPDLKD